MALLEASISELLFLGLDFAFSQAMPDDTHINLSIWGTPIQEWQIFQLGNHILGWKRLTFLSFLDNFDPFLLQEELHELSDIIVLFVDDKVLD